MFLRISALREGVAIQHKLSSKADNAHSNSFLVNYFSPLCTTCAYING